MELKDLKIEELVKVRTQIMLEGKSTKTINRVIDEKENILNLFLKIHLQLVDQQVLSQVVVLVQ